MVIAGDYMVFILQPMYFNTFDILTTRKVIKTFLLFYYYYNYEFYFYQTVWGSLNYKNEDCEILIFDKNSLELVKTCYTSRFYFWHFTNGYVNSEGQIVL